MLSKSRLLLAATGLGLLLSGCGGGGGGGVGSTPAPGSGASMPSVPTPPIINYDDAEYTRSSSAKAAQALGAYSAGATGAGVKIAIVDSGLSNSTGEFTGRIDPASTDLAGSRGYTDESGHGTAVAAVAAAAHNGSRIEGVAFGAIVLALRTDDPGSCASSDGCSHFDSALASAVDYARNQGAKVINMSLGGSAMDSTLRAAVNRATTAGIIVVISAGNCGQTSADCTVAETQPDAFARVANQTDAHGLVIIAGSTNSFGTLSGFSNPAGGFGQYYLAALGEGVTSFDHTGTNFFYNGTSFSAPAISGAVALLAQAFPNLTGAQIVDLLMRTATDAGAPGTDSVYGRGVLNITSAFAPQGSTALAGSAVPISLTDNGTLSSAMGDANASAAGQAVILDGYQRAYRLDLGGTIRRAGLMTRPLREAIGRDISRTAVDLGPAAIAMNVANAKASGLVADADRLALSNHPLAAPKALGGTMTLRLGAKTDALVSFGERLEGGPAPSAGGAWLVARAPEAMAGFDAERGLSLGVRQALGHWSLTSVAERGTLLPLRAEPVTPGYTLMTIKAERAFGRFDFGAELGLLREQGSVLGARFGSALGGGGALSRIADISLGYDLGTGWRLGAQYRQYWTAVDRGGALTSGQLASNAFAFDLQRQGRQDRFGLRLAQPLRVASGRYQLTLPSSYDYGTQTTLYASSTISLAPRGREIDLEASYGRRLIGGWLDANLYLRRDPGNIAAAQADHGLALRYNASF